MKKIMALFLIIGLLATGCAGVGQFSSGAQGVVDFACSPTDAEKAEAAKWLTALDAIQAGAAAFYPPLAIVQASSVMTVLKNGGCFVLTEVQAALDLLANMQAKQVKMMGVKGTPRTPAEQFPALTARVKAVK
jgi:hypothetical protein